jgi:thiol-disulfide isomerase/thioredoxin
MSEPKPLPPEEREFLVVCLCAAWCGTCREYEAGFRELEQQYPAVGFLWVDIEDENSGVEDWDIENFPTLLIQRADTVLFFGPMLPQASILHRALDTYLAQTPADAGQYAHATAERAGWQASFNYRSVLKNL